MEIAEPGDVGADRILPTSLAFCKVFYKPLLQSIIFSLILLSHFELKRRIVAFRQMDDGLKVLKIFSDTIGNCSIDNNANEEKQGGDDGFLVHDLRGDNLPDFF